MKQQNKGLRVLLMSPPYPHLGGEESFGLAGREDWFPLGMFVIANAISLEKLADVKIYYQPDHSPKTLDAVIREFSPDIVGIGCFTRTRFACLELSKIIKKISKDIKVVWGGSHPTFLDGQIMKHYSCVDIIIRGYAESIFVDLLRAILDGSSLEDIKGLTWRGKNKAVHRSGDRPQENDLARELTPQLKELFIGDLPNWKSSDMISYGLPIETSRGCVYTCTFCSRMGPADRSLFERGPDQVMRYIRSLFEVFGKRQIFFSDTNFTLRKKAVIDFCHYIKKERLDIEWCCGTRVDLVNKEILTALREAGCQKIYYGVDSLCRKILPRIGRHFCPDVAVRNLNLSVECGLETEGNMILGFPDETTETVTESYENRLRLDPRVRLSARPLLIMPGGALYYQFLKEGFDENYWLEDHGNDFPIYTGAMSEALLKKYCELFKSPRHYLSRKQEAAVVSRSAMS